MAVPSKLLDYPLIAQSRLFHNVSLDAVDYLLESCDLLELGEGERLLTYGDPGNENVYLVLRGCLHVHLGETERTPHAILGAGESTGEMSVIDGETVSARVTAAEPCRLLVISQETLWAFMVASHAVALNLLWILSGRIRHDNEAIITSVKLQREFEHAAVVDGLTGLYNRLWLNDAFQRQVTRSDTENRVLTMVMIDIDQFKALNDTHGHLAGDRVLCGIAQVLVRHLRPGDLLARYAGDEFCLLLPDSTVEDGLNIAERLRQAAMTIPSPHAETAPIAPVTISLGVACLPAGDDLDALIADADAALYRAKRGGRNRVES